MVKISHASSPIRRPPPAVTLEEEDEPYIEPNELALNSFYNDTTTTPLHENYTTEQRSLPINPLIVEEEMNEFDFANHDNHNSFRRRRGDGGIDTANISHENEALISNTNYANSFTQHQQHQHSQHFTSNINTTHKSISKHLTWNRLNATLFIGQALLSIATTAPITLVPHFALSLAGTNEDETWNYSPYYNMEILEVYDENGNRKRWIPFRVRRSNGSNNNNNNEINSSSIFASHLTAIVTLVTAMGKIINGPLVDLAGARRLLLVYGLCTGLALVGLRCSNTPGSAIACCALIEFFNSINWPANIVILGAHYGTSRSNTADSDGMFERGLYVTSLACRCGSLLIIPLSSLLIKWTSLTWRGVAGIASFAAFSAVVVFYIYLTDSPGKRHDPQNPISEQVEKKKTLYSNVPSQNAYHPTFHSWTPKEQTLSERASKFVKSVFVTVLPSIRAVLKSRVFWAVAIAHAGATMVKSSERILGTYFRDTSYGVVTESKAGAMTVFLSLGMLMGLLVGGKAFARAAEKEQGNNNIQLEGGQGGGQSSLIDAAQVGTKNMIAFFYCLSICSCYILSFLAMPFVRKALHLPVLVLILQALTTLFLGFGIAVQYYHIPAIVGATYGKNRGLYTAYTDGVAALVSSIVWRIVGGAVEEGNPQGAGWSYGWAGLALLLVFCGTLMIKIVELYLVGGGWHHNNIPTSHESSKTPDETQHLIDLNTSWMDEEIQTVKPLRNPTREFNVLSSSALDFIHHSPMRHKYGRKSLLATVESRDEDDTTTVSGGGVEVDLLGIDDDGSVLFPSSTVGHESYVGTHPISSSIAHDIVSFKPTFDGEDTDIRATSTFSDVYEYNKGGGLKQSGDDSFDL